MKVEIYINHKQEVTYPYFGKAAGDVIVCFIAPKTGIQVTTFDTDECGVYKAVGAYGTEWNENIFEPLPKGSKVTFTV